MKLTLLVRNQSDEENSLSRVYSINKNTCTIGRKAADVLVQDPECAEQHAVLFHDEKGHLCLQSMGNAKPVFIRDRKIESAKLQVGNEFLIGNSLVLILAAYK